MLKNIETGQGHTAVVVAIKIKKREIGISRFFYLDGWTAPNRASFVAVLQVIVWGNLGAALRAWVALAVERCSADFCAISCASLRLPTWDHEPRIPEPVRCLLFSRDRKYSSRIRNFRFRDGVSPRAWWRQRRLEE